uniref:DUF5615 domain-containing protein n=1 Tax=Candidatus Kentrum sp. UNK TaxID=2126344 RepID=A0A451AZN0_9GAMM|nr:MAG: hypothetical protein BECKUNK1418G_GA0071005_106516 [Candidatus Kentron sp. UNK]VFK71522.1 MAG: hypothetical protein BECKUNK1418H_GA0071006_107016 [Candidatus Kentron sp. UNK]
MSSRKVLLDECVDRKLANYITGHSVQTVRKVGWAGFGNGDLLRRAEVDFDVLVTTDRNLIYQQNVVGFDIAVIVLSGRFNRIKDLLPLLPELLEAIPVVSSGTALVLKTL